MKIRYYIQIILFTGTVVFFSCSNDLDIEQPSTVTSNSMWKEEGDYTSFVNGMYSNFRSGNNLSLNIWGDLRSGYYGDAILDHYANALRNNQLVVDVDGSNWNTLYTTINYANLIIKHIDDIEWDNGKTRDGILANGYFMRAWCYFHIVRIWGDAPLLVEGFESMDFESMYPSREPASEIYSLIASDIDMADKLLTEGNELYLASPGAINMLKAEFFLWEAKQLESGNNALAIAKTAIDKVLNNVNYTLAPDYADLFGCSTNEDRPVLSAEQLGIKESNREYIWSLPYSQIEYTGGYMSYVGVNISNAKEDLRNDPIPIGTHAQYLSLGEDFVDWLENELPNNVVEDKRHNVNWLHITSEENGELDEIRVIRKFSGEWTNETRYFTNDVPMYRLAEAYLLKAEVENELGNHAEALSNLNKIAFRAYGHNAYSVADKLEIDEAIMDEYLREFVLENKYWWVLRRFGACFDRVGNLKGRENVTNILLWPIASASLNTNPDIEQTEGY